jgi:hypothetical protein
MARFSAAEAKTIVKATLALSWLKLTIRAKKICNVSELRHRGARMWRLRPVITNIFRIFGRIFGKFVGRRQGAGWEGEGIQGGQIIGR